MHMNFHLAFEKEKVPVDKRETVFRYGGCLGSLTFDRVVVTLFSAGWVWYSAGCPL